MEQSELFGEPLPDVTRNFHRGNEFSEAANEEVHPHKGKQQAAIIEHMRTVKDAICDEVEAALGLSHQAVSARFRELKNDGILVMVLDADYKHARRATRSGKNAGVWKLRESL